MNTGEGAWLAAAQRDELAIDKTLRVELQGHRYLLVDRGGAVHAVDDRCSHEDASLYLGCVQGERIKCPLHGSYFSLVDGQALDEPADSPIGVYQTRVVNGVRVG